jgi:putative transposase
MGRRLRFMPREESLVEVTNITMQDRFLLKPSEQLTEIILGILGRAQARFGMIIHAFQFLSNHFHMLLSPRNLKQQADFMCFVESNIAKEAGALHDWRGKFWSGRYKAIVVDEDEYTQVSRLKYLLSNGCKEGLVAKPQDWTGASVAVALLNGVKTLTGVWYDRTKEYRARRGGKSEVHSSVETITLTPLPCWAALDDEKSQQNAISLIQEIENETARMHKEKGTSPLGMEAVLKHNPHSRPKSIKNTPAPLFHAATRDAREKLRAAYQSFVECYRNAAERLKSGEFNVAFPSDCFPPPRPFVVAHAPG